VDFVTSSPGEAKGMVDAGLVRHLAIMANQPSELYGQIPRFNQATPYDWSLTTWNVLAAPKGLSPDIAETLAAAMKKVYASGELQKFANNQGFEVNALYGDALRQFMKDEDARFGRLLVEDR